MHHNSDLKNNENLQVFIFVLMHSTNLPVKSISEHYGNIPEVGKLSKILKPTCRVQPLLSVQQNPCEIKKNNVEINIVRV